MGHSVSVHAYVNVLLPIRIVIALETESLEINAIRRDNEVKSAEYSPVRHDIGIGCPV
ncbi:MAG: hypothetical protein WCJ09_28215 [Planctomycetota bacterium]